MQFFIIFAVLIGGFTCLEARFLKRSLLQTRQGYYIAPGSTVSFSTDPNFQTPRVYMAGTFTTLATATLRLSCTMKLPCANGAYIKVTNNAGQVAGFYCSAQNVWVQMPDVNSVSSMAIEIFSGDIADSQYNCLITSVAASTCQCGTRPGRIVGGTQVTEGEIPWQVGLGSGVVGNFNIFCGGTLISENFVISAAHCVRNTDLNTLVFLGSVNLKSTSATVRNVLTITRHEQYDITKNNDIVIIRLSAPVTYSSTIFPACLPRRLRAETFAGQSLSVSGWGYTAEGSTVKPSMLSKATVVGLTNTQCARMYAPNDITSVMLCAANPNTDSCQGDSGGPLTFTTDAVTYLVGVVSWGIGCAKPQYPGVYTRVTSFLDWIDTKTGGPLCSK